MVFILLILLPIFNSDFWVTTDTAGDLLCTQYQSVVGLQADGLSVAASLEFSAADADYSQTDLKKLLAYVTKNTADKFSSLSLGNLLKVVFPGSKAPYYLDPEFGGTRKEEMIISSCELAPGKTAYIYQQNRQTSKLESGLGVVRTIYISLILIGGSYLFSFSAHVLVIGPIERMIEKVVGVIEKPQAIKEEEFIAQEERDFRKNMESLEEKEEKDQREEDALPNKDRLETQYLEKAINKIGVLLGVGLGDAGSELINNFLNKETNILNIANHLEAAYCFCDIRNFTDATEILQEEVMVFVNTIADIVHSIADSTLGAANKNVGDAFLIVWKVSPEDELAISTKNTDMADVWQNLTDLAFYSVVLMQAEIGRANSLKRFVDNEKMRNRIGKGFKIRLGFGLHFGWAIEGALGSHFKVDATYLSPHINMAMRLEGETKKYGVPVLLSGEFFERMSPVCQELCRKIDSMELSDGEHLELYTPLASDRLLRYADSKPIDSHVLRTKDRANFKKLIKNDLVNGRKVAKRVFENDKDVSLMFSTVSPQLGKSFKIAFDLFTAGHWDTAKPIFESLTKSEQGDGPSKFLLEFMKETGYQKPFNWRGFRLDQDSGGH